MNTNAKEVNTSKLVLNSLHIGDAQKMYFKHSDMTKSRANKQSKYARHNAKAGVLSLGPSGRKCFTYLTRKTFT